ncbi:MAG TPA: hypothetical protein VJ854_03125 [Sphaerochaeta sp.]|nr:hypothetical protein [Sphaerochaeta sp.]
MGFELLLPVVLFILTLAIIFLLRSDDKRNVRTDLIRKRAQALLKNVENSQTQFKESAQKLEERISKKIDESHLLMSQVDSQLADLEARSEDLATLQSVLATYQTSLTQLEGATTQVEQRIVLVKHEVANLNRVHESLSAFDLRFEQFKGSLGSQIAEGEEAMNQQQLRIKEMLGASFAKLQEYEGEVHSIEQEALTQVAFHADALKNRQDASLDLVSVQVGKLRQLAQEGEEQILLHEKAQLSMHKQSQEKLQEEQRQFTLLTLQHAEQQKRQQEQLNAIEEDAQRHITESMQAFVRQFSAEMATLFEMTLKKTDVSFQNMIGVVSLYLKELSSRLEQARALITLMDGSEHTALFSFKDELEGLLEATAKGEQSLHSLQALEAEASSALGLVHNEALQLQQSLATMREEKLALLKKSEADEISPSVVFSMALVDETCNPCFDEQASSEVTETKDEALGEEADPVAEEDLPSVAFAMALSDGPEDEKGRTKRKPRHEKVKHEAASDTEQQDDAEKRRVEYLAESEEEVIILDEDDTFSP